MVTLLFSSLLVHANTWLLFPGSWTNSEALRSVRPRLVFGKIALSSWGDDEPDRPVQRKKRRPNNEAAVAVAEDVSLVDDELVEVAAVTWQLLSLCDCRNVSIIIHSKQKPKKKKINYFRKTYIQPALVAACCP